MDDAPPIEGGAFQILTLASKGNGMRAPAADGSPAGGELRPFNIPGEGLYVVDCPQGWPGFLELDGRRFPIHAGAVIPERYQRVSLVCMPPAGTVAAGAIAYADSPVVLAVGPRGHLYRRPGWRVHWWNQLTLNVGGVIDIAPGGDSQLTERIYIEGYDSWLGWYYFTAAAGNIVLSPRWQYSNPFPGAFGGEQGIHRVTAAGEVTIAAGFANIAHPVYYSSRRHAERAATTGGREQNFADLAVGTQLPPIPQGAQARYVRWGVTNAAGSSGGIPPNGHLFSASIHVD